MKIAMSTTATATVTRRIVATGGHSGLGLEALKRLLDFQYASHDCQIILYARDPSADHCQRAKRELLLRAAAHQARRSVTVDLRPMDLASLPSVRKAATTLCDELTSDPDSFVDIFLLNAAVAKSTRQLVADGEDESGTPDRLKDRQARYETTACVNHVAHLVFLQHLKPAILRFAVAAAATTTSSRSNGSQRTRIVFTGSALHRSLEDTSVLDDLFSSASRQNDAPWSLRQSYGSSKFLQMLGIRAYRRRLAEALKQQGKRDASGVDIVVVQPGFVPQTGLSRETGWTSRLAMNYVLPLMPFATSPVQAGEWIARACCVDLDEASSSAGAEPDGWSANGSLVRAALLEKSGSEQAFGKLDERTANVALQDQWWPSIGNT
ncbi:hypothetical protein ACQY0O_004468 [Thecaphora frezii]